MTKYLLQYRRIAIPHVGSFELVQQPPEYNVVDKIILPPTYALSWHRNDTLPDHQLSYLAASTQNDREKVKEELDQFGRSFKSRVQDQSFTWSGIGTLRHNYDTLSIDGERLYVDGLEAVPAHRVIRENVAHQMLVGDHETTTHHLLWPLQKKWVGRPDVVIGWVLFLLCLLAIIFLLYKNGFNPLSSGLRMKL